MLPENIIFITIGVSLFFSYFYIRDIIRGIFKPNLVTWFLWALAPLLAVFFQLKAGAGWSVLPVFLAGFFPAIIFTVALLTKHSHWKIGKLDIFCGVFSVLAIVFWIITKDPEMSIIFALLADILAAVPTVIKAYKFPETESAFGYIPGIVNNSLGLSVITKWSFSIYSFSLYIIILNIILIFLITRKKLKQIFA